MNLMVVICATYWLLSGAECGHISSFNVRFLPGIDYHYMYKSDSDILGAQNVTHIIKLRIRHHEKIDDVSGTSYSLFIDSVSQILTGKDIVTTNPEKWDLTKPFLFDLTPVGLIEFVHVHPKEHDEVSMLKKALTSLFIAHKPLSDRSKFKKREVDHGGSGEYEYEVDHYSDGVRIRRSLRNESDVIKNHDKTVHISNEGTIHRVESVDKIILKDRMSLTHLYQHNTVYEGLAELPEESSGDFPTLYTMSHTHLHLTNQLSHGEPFKMVRHTLVKQSIEVEQPKAKVITDSDAAMLDIEKEMNCSRITLVKTNTNRTECVRRLRVTLKAMVDADIEKVAEKYLTVRPNCENGTVCFHDRHVMIDMIAGLDTPISQRMILKYIFKRREQDTEEMRKALIHFALLKHPIEASVKAVEELCFGKDFEYHGMDIVLPGRTNETLTLRRACLTVGSMASSLNKTNPARAALIVGHLTSWLERHHDRTKRSADDMDYDYEYYTGMIMLHALGNAAHHTSFKLFKRYAEPNQGHSAWRRAALEAMKFYPHDESAEVLINLAFHDHHDVVRQQAYRTYTEHPKRYQLTDAQRDVILRRNASLVIPSNRDKRDIKDVLNAAFSWDIEIPGFSWTKVIGSKAIGTSFGITLRNKMTLKLQPSEGLFMIDVFDTAYVTANLGILGTSLDMFRLQVCFRGNIRYNLNMLSDFGFNSVQDLVNIFDVLYDKFVTPIEDAIDWFMNLMHLNTDFSGGFQALFGTFSQTIMDLPKNIVKTAEALSRWMEKTTDCLPWVKAIRKVILRVKFFIDDVKMDIENFVTAILDAVQVTIPYTIEQFEKTGEQIMESLGELINAPSSALEGLGQAFIRISMAMFMLVGAKKRMEINFPIKGGNLPYWMTPGEDLRTLKTDLAFATKEVVNMLKTFTVAQPLPFRIGVGATGLKGMDQQQKEIGMKFISALSNLLEPFEYLFKPLYDLYKSVLTFYNNIKDFIDIIKSLSTKAMDIVNKLMGSKFHKKFPRTRRSGANDEYGDGNWPTTANGLYSNKTEGIGIMLLADVAQKIVAPVTGVYYYERLPRQRIRIEPSKISMKKYVIFLYNIKYNRSAVTVSGKPVKAGEPIGTMKKSPGDSLKNFMFVSVREMSKAYRKMSFSQKVKELKKDGEWMDPTKYTERNSLFPRLVQDCNDRSVTILGVQVDIGSFAKDKEQKKKELKRDVKRKQDEFKNRYTKPEEPYRPIIIDPMAKRPLTEELKGVIDFVNDVKALLGGDTSKIWSIAERFDVGHFSLDFVVDLFKKKKLVDRVDALNILIKKLEDCADTFTVIHPTMWSPSTINRKLRDYGEDGYGYRVALINKLYQAVYKMCPHFLGGIMTGLDVYCEPHYDCLGLTCAVPIKYMCLQHWVQLDTRVDICGPKLIFKVGVGANQTTMKMKLSEKIKVINVDVSSTFDTMIARFYFDVTANRTHIFLIAKTLLCSSFLTTCIPDSHIFGNITFQIPSFSRFMCGIENVGESDDTLSARGFQSLSLNDLSTELIMCGQKSNEIMQLMNEIRDAMASNMDMVEYLVTAVFGTAGEFPGGSEFCLSGKVPVPTKDITFFELQWRFMAGPVPIKVEFGAGGSLGAFMGIKLCIMSMRAEVTAIPWAGAKVWGSIAISLGIIEAGAKLIGYLIETQFPTIANVGFQQFPLDLSGGMDLVLTPLRLELIAFVEVNLLFTSETLWEGYIWKYSMKPIQMNIFTISKGEDDKSPPRFQGPSTAKVFRRSGQPCRVVQLTDLDVTDTQFELAVDAQDDNSEVTMHYAVGSYKGGTDVIDWTQISATNAVVKAQMPGGVPLYFTVRAKNEQGMEALAQCHLETYDNTLPEGRVNMLYLYSANPRVIQGSVTAFEDSPIKIESLAHGLGNSPGEQNGDTYFKWEAFSFNTPTLNTLETGDLQSFTPPKEGRLSNVRPIAESEEKSSSACARRCLNFGRKCISFMYDVINKACLLLAVIWNPSNDVLLKASAGWSYYERLNLGYAKVFRYDIETEHSSQYCINVDITNSLGYRNVINPGPGLCTMIDFTPPDPANIVSPKSDEVLAHFCEAAITQRCHEVTDKPNHRYIVDGPQDKAVFNGQKPLEEKLYQLATSYLNANWDEFEDKDSGMFGYTWKAGRKVCGNDTADFEDPHAHLASREHWTHTGLATFKSRPLVEGHYYFTVQGLNNVIFGGSLVTSVCHSRPLIIDITPPIFHAVEGFIYSEDLNMLIVDFNASDSLSGLSLVEFGLGRSKYDVKLRPYEDVSTDNPDVLMFLQLTMDEIVMPEGEPAWIRLQILNNVELFVAGHGESPLLVDKSPPIAGIVYDGLNYKHDLQFTSDNTQLCAHWQYFFDPHSGIMKYFVRMGSTAGGYDLTNNTDVMLSYRQKTYCKTGLSLTHNAVYYTMVTASNRGLVPKYVNGSSDGVRVDLTPPVQGRVTDGRGGLADMAYSRDITTIKAQWEGFSDPESNITKYDVDVLVNSALLESFPGRPNTDRLFDEHHFALKHSDRVAIKVTAENGATATTSAVSNGYIIDLTPPTLVTISDTDNPGARYQKYNDRLVLSWEYSDAESGIAEYRLTVYQFHSGVTIQYYPSVGAYETVAVGNGTIIKNLSIPLINGAKYFFKVVAINGAQLNTKHESAGVVVDVTPPSMSKVHVGLLEEDEELDPADPSNPTVMHIGSEGLNAYWRGFDYESGITKYYVAIGTTSGGDQVVAWKDMEVDNTGLFADLGLQPFTTRGLYYYISVKCVNGAGDESSVMTSKRIKVLAGNEPGVVFDGRVKYEDASWQDDVTSVAMSFKGFKSEACGIVGYDWGIGSQAGYTDLQPFMMEGIVMDVNNTGYAQANLHLTKEKAFVTVRAITGHNCHEDIIVSESDGFQLDSTPPILELKEFGSVVDLSDPHRVLYESEEADMLSFHWNSTDYGVGNKTMYYRVGQFPGSGNLRKWTATSDNYMPLGTVKLGQGDLVFGEVLSVDQLGNSVKKLTPGVTVDVTPPLVENYRCYPYVSATNLGFDCSWSIASDNESSVTYMAIAVGTSHNSTDMIDWYVLPPYRRTWKYHFLEKNLSTGVKYFATLRVKNRVGHDISLSDEIIYIIDPPTAGQVKIVTPSKFPLTPNVDVVCQIAQTFIDVQWTPFADDTPLDRYEIALGTAQSSTSILPFTSVGLVTSHSIRGLNLAAGTTLRASVRAVNAAGLFTSAVSQFVLISPDLQVKVYDLKPGDLVSDADFQEEESQIQGRYEIANGAIVTKAEWAIYRADGYIVQNFTTIPTDNTFFMNDQLVLENLKMYYSVIRITDILGRTVLAASDGVTLNKYPPKPGEVRDGPYRDRDLNFYEPYTYLECNWDEFGEPGSLDPSKVISHYMVGLGNDRSTEVTRTNIHWYVDVGTNLSYTFVDLNLTKVDVVYYCAVRAFSMSGSFSDGYSNGIAVGYEYDIGPGGVMVEKYWSRNKTLPVSWEKFGETFANINYQVALATKGVAARVTSMTGCRNYADMSHNIINDMSFDVLNWTDVKTDTMVTLTNLSLQHNTYYYPIVKAINEADHCYTEVGEPVLIDLTEPVMGEIDIGNIYNEVAFFSTKEKLQVTWKDFRDAESGIDYYNVYLTRDDCSNKALAGAKLEPLFAPTKAAANDTSLVFMPVDLQLNSVHYVLMTATNKARMRSQFVASYPGFLDHIPPVVGHVVDGDSWYKDITYTSSVNELVVTMAIANHKEQVDCPDTRELNISSWKSITGHSQYLDKDDPRTLASFYSANNSILLSSKSRTLKCQQDSKKNFMKCAGIQGEAEMIIEGKYSVTMQIAAGYKVMTTFAMTEELLDEPDVGVAPTVVDEKTAADILAEGAPYVPPTIPPVMSTDVTEPATTITTEAATTTTTTMATTPTAVVMTTSGAWNGSSYASMSTSTAPVKTINEPGDVVNFKSGFGLTFFGYQHGNQTKVWFVKMWARYLKVSKQEWTKLINDPTRSEVTYSIHVYLDPDDPKRDSWRMTLYENGDESITLTGVRPPKKAHPVVHTWMKDKFMPRKVNPFSVYETSTIVSGMSVPLPPTRPCHYGKPFYDFESHIGKIYIGVSDSNLKNATANIAAFKLMKDVCIGCYRECDFNCNPNCTDTNKYDFSPITLRLTSLNLSAGALTKMSDNTLVYQPAVYFVIVKVESRSGLQVNTTTNGITVDISPPIIQNMSCLDPGFSMDQPTSYSSTANTMGAMWNVIEMESLMADQELGLFRTANLNETVVNYTNIGLGDKGVLKFDNVSDGDYYVALRATNVAGLSSVRSCLLSLLTLPPNVTEVSVDMPGTKIEPDLGKVHVQSRQDELQLSWSDVPKGVKWVVMEVKMTDSTHREFVPKAKVGTQSSHSVTVKGGKFIMDGVYSDQKLSDLKKKTVEDADAVSSNTYGDDKMKLEPGACMEMKVTAEGVNHMEVEISKEVICVTRSNDSTISLGSSRVKRSLQKITVVNVTMAIEGTGGVIYGELTKADLAANYGSAASDAPSYIIDMEANRGNMAQHSRRMMRRVNTVIKAWFVSGTAETQLEYIIATLWFDNSTLADDEIPTVLYYDPIAGKIKEACESCGSCSKNYQQHIDWNATTITVTLCQMWTTLESKSFSNTRRKRKVAVDFELNPTELSVAQVAPQPFNDKPYLSNAQNPFKVYEDFEATLTLEYKDTEGDRVQMNITNQPPHGTASVIGCCTVRYKPYEDFATDDIINVTLNEVNMPSDITPNVVYTNISIQVINDNDEPILYFAPNDFDEHQTYITEGGGDTKYDVIVENEITSVTFGKVLVYDVDANNNFTIKIDESGLNATQFKLETREVKDFDNIKKHIKVPFTMSYVTTWYAVEVKVTFPENYYGNLTMGIMAVDQDDVYSGIVYLNIYVRDNPCVHGNCSGPPIYKPPCIKGNCSLPCNPGNCSTPCNPGNCSIPCTPKKCPKQQVLSAACIQGNCSRDCDFGNCTGCSPRTCHVNCTSLPECAVCFNASLNGTCPSNCTLLGCNNCTLGTCDACRPANCTDCIRGNCTDAPEPPIESCFKGNCSADCDFGNCTGCMPRTCHSNCTVWPECAPCYNSSLNGSCPANCSAIGCNNCTLGTCDSCYQGNCTDCIRGNCSEEFCIKGNCSTNCDFGNCTGCSPGTCHTNCTVLPECAPCFNTSLNTSCPANCTAVGCHNCTLGTCDGCYLGNCTDCVRGNCTEPCEEVECYPCDPGNCPPLCDPGNCTDHRATCVKDYCPPATGDPNCTTKDRAFGFHDNGYSCSCELGYTGINCHLEIDECASNPCPSYHQCKDYLGYYECVFKRGAADATISGMLTGVAAGVAVLVAILLVAIMALTVFLCRRRQASSKVSDINSSKSGGSLRGLSPLDCDTSLTVMDENQVATEDENLTKKLHSTTCVKTKPDIDSQSAYEEPEMEELQLPPETTPSISTQPMSSMAWSKDTDLRVEPHSRTPSPQAWAQGTSPRSSPQAWAQGTSPRSSPQPSPRHSASSNRSKLLKTTAPIVPTDKNDQSFESHTGSVNGEFKDNSTDQKEGSRTGSAGSDRKDSPTDQKEGSRTGSAGSDRKDSPTDQKEESRTGSAGSDRKDSPTDQKEESRTGSAGSDGKDSPTDKKEGSRTGSARSDRKDSPTDQKEGSRTESARSHCSQAKSPEKCPSMESLNSVFTEETNQHPSLILGDRRKSLSSGDVRGALDNISLA